MRLFRHARVLTITLVVSCVIAAGCGTDAPGNNGATTTTSTPSRRDPNQRYRVSTTVLESPTHGPQLCLGGVAESLPPQCGGPDVEGLDWQAVADKESLNGTTWAELTVVGTFDGATFSLTEPPRPVGSRPPAEVPDFSPLCSDPEGDRTADRNTFREPTHPDLVAVWISPDQKTFNVLVRPGAADAVRREIRSSFTGLLCIAERDLPTQASLLALQNRIFDDAKGSPLGGVFGSAPDPRRGVVVVSCAIADQESKAWAADQWGDKIELVGLLQPVVYL